MKPSPKQLVVLKSILEEVRYWETSNDIHSPSHGTSIMESMSMHTLDNVLTDEEADKVSDALARLWNTVASLTECELRHEVRERLKSNPPTPTQP